MASMGAGGGGGGGGRGRCGASTGGGWEAAGRLFSCNMSAAFCLWPW
jgi:hypothetical protein